MNSTSAPQMARIAIGKKKTWTSQEESDKEEREGGRVGRGNSEEQEGCAGLESMRGVVGKGDMASPSAVGHQGEHDRRSEVCEGSG